MGQSVEITRTEHSASELRALAAKTKDGAVVRRLLALALTLEGHSRETAATANGMTRQTLRDWVHRYNADGVAGLRSSHGGGPTPLLGEPEMVRVRTNRWQMVAPAPHDAPATAAGPSEKGPGGLGPVRNLPLRLKHGRA
jgi:hypothetical protein